MLADGERLANGVDLDPGGARDARLAHAARDHGRVEVMPPCAVRMPGVDDHAVDVVGVVSEPDEHDAVFAPLAALGGGVGVEDHLTDGGTWRGGKSVGCHTSMEVQFQKKWKKVVTICRLLR